MYQELETEIRWANEELEAKRLEAERRFSPPPGDCPWGCDGSGWRQVTPEGASILQDVWHKLWPDVPYPETLTRPGALDVVCGDQWWTPCECNVASLRSLRVVRRALLL